MDGGRVGGRLWHEVVLLALLVLLTALLVYSGAVDVSE